MKKRILSVLLATLMIFGSVGTFAMGAAADDTFKIVAETTKNNDGTYAVDIMMYNSPMISTMDFSITYDNTKIKLVDYEGYAPDAQPFPKYAPTSCLGDVTSKLGEGKTALEDFGTEEAPINLVYYKVGVNETINGKLLGLTFELAEGVKNAELDITLNAPCSQEPYEGAEKNYFTPEIVDGFVGVRTFEGLELADAEYVFDGTAKSLTLVGADDTMNVVWTNNNQKNAGEYAVTAVVSKPGYETATLTATLTITQATANLINVELWPVVEGEIPEIKSLANAQAELPGVMGWDLYFNNPAVVYEGGVYKLTGVTVSSANVVLDTTVYPTFVSADELDQKVVDSADIMVPALHPAANKLPALEYDLPSGYELVLVANEYIDENGNITRPNDDDKTVSVVYKVYKNGQDTGVTYSYDITLKKQAAGGAVSAALLLYYYKQLEAAKTPVATVTANIASGSNVAAGTKVALSTATEGATIYYTTDGTTATSLSKVYTGEITIDESMTISAIAKVSGKKTSAPASFTYTVAENSVKLKENASEIKYLEGRGDKFEPEAAATRYEVIKAIANLYDIAPINAPVALTDVDAEYKELVDLCTAAGIIKGYDDNTFRGNSEIKRSEIATIICNIMDLDVDAAEDAGFTDVTGWATKYINACAKAKYMQGKGDNMFDPDAFITRAEIARLFNNITEAKDGDSCSYADVDMNKWYGGCVAAAAK